MHKHHLQLSRADVGTVAVVCGSNPDGDFHAGILYNDHGRVFFLHQLWDYWTRSEPFESHDGIADRAFPFGFACATPDLEPEQANDVVGRCVLTANRYPATSRPGAGIPYAFEYPLLPHFTPRGQPNEGAFLVTNDGRGLTCSSFVLAIFEAESVPLVVIETWEPREDDDRRHATLLVRLRRVPLEHPGYPVPSEAHMRALSDTIVRQCIRVRPEETVGACLLDRPSTFRPTEAAGEWTLIQLSGIGQNSP